MLEKSENINPLEDRRNLIDEYKGLKNEEVVCRLNKKRNELEVAIENIEHDFNVGTIVRSANNFNVSRVHIIGKKKYNRRGAMCTDKYLKIYYWKNTKDFFKDQRKRGQEIVAIENNIDLAKPLGKKKFQRKTTLVFGSEGSGLSSIILEGKDDEVVNLEVKDKKKTNIFNKKRNTSQDRVDDVRYIESFGSTRSVNVGVAAGIAMYEWTRQNIL